MAENTKIVIPEFGAPEVLDCITSEIPQSKDVEAYQKMATGHIRGKIVLDTWC